MLLQTIFPLTLEKAFKAFQVEPCEIDTRNRRQRTVYLYVQSRNSHSRKLPSLIRTVLNKAYPFSERKKEKNGQQLFYIYSVTADGIGSLASVADYFGKD